MKTLILLLISLIGTAAMACPNLKGLYQVPGDLAFIEIDQTGCDRVLWRSREAEDFVVSGPNTIKEPTRKQGPTNGLTTNIQATSDRSFFIGDKLFHVSLYAMVDLSPGSVSVMLNAPLGETLYLNDKGDLVREISANGKNSLLTFPRIR